MRGRAHGRGRGRGRRHVAPSDGQSCQLTAQPADAVPHLDDTVPHLDEAVPHLDDAVSHLDDTVPHLDAQGQSSASSTTSRSRKRGRNKCTKFNQVYAQDPIHLEIPSGAQGAICSNSTMFSRRVSYIVRNNAELHHDSWCKVPSEHKEMLKNRVLAEFLLNIERYEERRCLELALSKSYCRIRHEYFKDYYKKFGRTEIPENMAEDTWHLICNSFETDSWKGKSKRNRENREKLKTNHTAGSRSFLRHREELRIQRGKEPRWVDYYKICRTKSNGSFVTSECEGKYNEMERRLNSDEVDSTQEQIFKEVLGTRSGHARGMGRSVIPTLSSSSRLRHDGKGDAENYKQRWEETQQEVTRLEEKLVENQRQSEEHHRQAEEKLEEHRRQAEEKLEEHRRQAKENQRQSAEKMQRQIDLLMSYINCLK